MESSFGRFPYEIVTKILSNVNVIDVTETAIVIGGHLGKDAVRSMIKSRLSLPHFLSRSGVDGRKLYSIMKRYNVFIQRRAATLYFFEDLVESMLYDERPMDKRFAVDLSLYLNSDSDLDSDLDYDKCVTPETSIRNHIYDIEEMHSFRKAIGDPAHAIEWEFYVGGGWDAFRSTLSEFHHTLGATLDKVDISAHRPIGELLIGGSMGKIRYSLRTSSNICPPYYGRGSDLGSMRAILSSSIAVITKSHGIRDKSSIKHHVHMGNNDVQFEDCDRMSVVKYFEDTGTNISDVHTDYYKYGAKAYVFTDVLANIHRTRSDQERIERITKHRKLGQTKKYYDYPFIWCISVDGTLGDISNATVSSMSQYIELLSVNENRNFGRWVKRGSYREYMDFVAHSSTPVDNSINMEKISRSIQHLYPFWYHPIAFGRFGIGTQLALLYYFGVECHPEWPNSALEF